MDGKLSTVVAVQFMNFSSGSYFHYLLLADNYASAVAFVVHIVLNTRWFKKILSLLIAHGETGKLSELYEQTISY